jgi:hypothetical protein
VIQKSHQIPKTTKPLEHKALSNCVESLGVAKIQQNVLFVLTKQAITIAPNQLVWNLGST